MNTGRSDTIDMANMAPQLEAPDESRNARRASETV
jgi:hypothetical protein